MESKTKKVECDEDKHKPKRKETIIALTRECNSNMILCNI